MIAADTVTAAGGGMPMIVMLGIYAVFFAVIIGVPLGILLHHLNKK